MISSSVHAWENLYKGFTSRVSGYTFITDYMLWNESLNLKLSLIRFIYTQCMLCWSMVLRAIIIFESVRLCPRLMLSEASEAFTSSLTLTFLLCNMSWNDSNVSYCIYY